MMQLLQKPALAASNETAKTFSWFPRQADQVAAFSVGLEAVHGSHLWLLWQMLCIPSLATARGKTFPSHASHQNAD